MLKQRQTVPLLMQPLQLLLLKLLAHLPTELLRPLLLHKARLTEPCLLQAHHNPAATLTKQAWNACSRSQCPSKIWIWLFERRACRGVFYARTNRFRNTVGTLYQQLDNVPVELPRTLCRYRNKLFGHLC